MKCEPLDFSIIVIDNGSSDGSVELLADEYSQIRCIALEQNIGFAPAVNLGIREADTEYVILLNNDTRVEPDFVDKLEKALDSDALVFSASAKMVDMNNPEVLDGAGDLYCALGWAFARGKGKQTSTFGLQQVGVFSACAGAAIYRKDVLMQIGLFDDNHFAYLEDVDVGYRARISGYKNVYACNAICYHAGSGFSGSRHNEFKVKLSSRNNVYLVLKNMPILQLLINAPLLIIGHLIKILFFATKGLARVYIKGLVSGVALYVSPKGHKQKVKFRISNLRNYFGIQLELWWNIVRRFVNY